MISCYVMQYISNLFLPVSLLFALWVNHLQNVLPCFEFPRKMEYMILDIFLIKTVILKLFWICLSVLVLSADHASERGLIIIINSWRMLISGWELPMNSGQIEPPQI